MMNDGFGLVKIMENENFKIYVNSAALSMETILMFYKKKIPFGSRNFFFIKSLLRADVHFVGDDALCLKKWKNEVKRKCGRAGRKDQK